MHYPWGVQKTDAFDRLLAEGKDTMTAAYLAKPGSNLMQKRSFRAAFNADELAVASSGIRDLINAVVSKNVGFDDSSTADQDTGLPHVRRTVRSYEEACVVWFEEVRDFERRWARPTTTATE